MTDSTPLRRAVLAICVFTTPLATPLAAQVKASEPAVLSQTVDGTRFTIEYSRPRARGRDTLFGKVVPWGEVWTPGANMATTLEVSNDVTIEGRPLRKGKYSLWMQVQPGDWTMVIDTNPKLYHTQHPKEDPSQLRWTFTPGTGPFTDVLTWEFERLRVDGGTLVMRWGTVRVPLEVKVPPSYTLAFDAAAAAPYLGTWVLTPQMGDDTASTRLEVAHRDGMMVATLDPPLFGAPEYRTMVFLPKRADWFTPAYLVDGEVYEIWDEVLVEFERSGGRPTTMTMRGLKDEVYGRGRRLP